MLTAAVGLIVLAIVVLLALKIARDSNWGILAIFFLLPFERIPTVDLAGFTLKLNHLIGGLVIIFWFIELVKFPKSEARITNEVRNPKSEIQSKIRKFENSSFVSHPTNTFIWLLIVALILSFAQAVSPMRSAIFFVQALFVVGLYGVIVNRVNRVEMVEKVVNIILVSTWLVVLFALYQLVGDYLGWPTGLDQGYTHKVLSFPRVQAFAKEPLYLANLLFIPLGLMIGWLVQKEKPMPKQMTILMPLTILVFLLTVSRGAYLGLLAFGVFCIVIFGRQLLTKRAIKLAGLALILAAFGVLLTLGTLGPQVAERFIAQATARDIGLSSESIFGRLRAFGQAVDVWQTSPVTGVGLGGFGVAVGQEISTGLPIVNNQYLELLAEAGLVGLLAFVLIMISIGAVFLRIWRQHPSVAYLPAMLGGLMAAWVGTLVQYNFFSTLAIIHIWVLIGLIVAIQSILLKKIGIVKVK